MSRTASKKATFYMASGFVVATMLGLLMLVSLFATYTEGAQLQEELTQHLTAPSEREVEPIEEPPYVPAEEPEEEVVYIPETFPLPYGVILPEVDFDALREINPNVVGWILLPGTPINLPVVQGENNYHYLNHLFDGRRSGVGTIFVDTYNRPGFIDHNTILYGHNMQDGSMFAAIRRFRSQEFFDTHPMAFLLTPDGNYVIRFFAGHTTDVHSQSWRIQFADDAEMEAWIEENRRLSDFVSDVEVGPRDRLITLATCTTSWESSNARYVVVGRLMPIG